MNHDVLLADKRESFSTRLLRWRFNWFPAFFGAGGHIECIAHDFRYVRVGIPLSWRTRNYVGTIFGGSMYGAVDPVYMVMFIKNLGPDFRVWDKASTIEFRKPAKSRLKAEFTISEEDVCDIRASLETELKLDRTYLVELYDVTGELCAHIQKTLHFSKAPLEEAGTEMKPGDENTSPG